MNHELGSIQITAELRDESCEEITGLSDVKQKYGFLREKPKEYFYAVFLNSDNTVIGDKLISLGGTSRAQADVKDIARTAVLTNASAIILIHNHPSTNNTPSANDKDATRNIQKALELFDIEILDHVIISQNGYYSMKDNDDL